MGSRIILPLIALLLVVAGLTTWYLSGEGSGGRAAGPDASEPATASSSDEPVAIASPRSTGDQAASPARQAQPARTERKPDGAKARDEKPQGPRVVGRVVDKLGNPLAGVQVDLVRGLTFGLGARDRGGNTPDFATTEADGRFAILGPPSTSMSLSARTRGYAPLEPRQVHVPAEGDFDVGDLVLSRGAILSGHVLDAAGRPVEGARLFDAMRHGGFLASEAMLVRSRQPLAVTQEDGSFVIESLACGAWEFLVRSEDHPTLEVSGKADVPGREVSGLVFQFAAASTITGRVAGLPEEGAERLAVRARPIRPQEGGGLGFGATGMRQVDCAADGTFELKGLEVGQLYELQARAVANQGDMLVFAGGIRSDTVRAQAGDRGIELDYSRGSSLSFQVIDDDTGEPVTSLIVSAGVQFAMPVRDEDGRVRREFEDGRVEIPGLYPRGGKRTAKLEVESTGYYDFELEDVELLPGENLDLGVLRLEPAPVVVVNVTDARSGVPVTGASVTLTPAPEAMPEGQMRFEMDVSIGDGDDEPRAVVQGSSRALTDEFGVATLNSIEGQNCILRVESDGHAPYELPGLYLPPGERVERDVELHEGGSVVVSVVDPHGEPLPGVKVEHRDSGTGPQRMMFGPDQSSKNRTDAAGQVVFGHLEPGLHAFRILDSEGGGFFGDGEAMVVMAGARTDDEKDSWTEVQVTEGSTGQVLLEASPRGLVEGIVLESGVALAGASLTLKKRKREGAPGMPDLGAMFGGGGAKARTDGEGYYSFEGVKAGEYTLEIDHPSRALPAERDLEVVERGGEVHLRFDVDLPVTILEGRVTNSEGRGLANVEVWAERKQADGIGGMQLLMIEDSGGDASVSLGGEPGDGRVRTDADGYYRLRGVPADVELEVHADAELHQEARSEPVTVSANQVRDGIDMVLDVAGRVEVSVVGPDGNSAGMCLLVAEYLGEGTVDPRREVVGPTGSAVLSGLKPGPWRIGAEAFGQEDQADQENGRRVEVVAGETSTLTLDAP